MCHKLEIDPRFAKRKLCWVCNAHCMATVKVSPLPYFVSFNDQDALCMQQPEYHEARWYSKDIMEMDSGNYIKYSHDNTAYVRDYMISDGRARFNDSLLKNLSPETTAYL